MTILSISSRDGWGAPVADGDEAGAVAESWSVKETNNWRGESIWTDNGWLVKAVTKAAWLPVREAMVAEEKRAVVERKRCLVGGGLRRIGGKDDGVDVVEREAGRGCRLDVDRSRRPGDNRAGDAAAVVQLDTGLLQVDLRGRFAVPRAHAQRVE